MTDSKVRKEGKMSTVWVNEENCMKPLLLILALSLTAHATSMQMSYDSKGVYLDFSSHTLGTNQFTNPTPTLSTWSFTMLLGGKTYTSSQTGPLWCSLGSCDNIVSAVFTAPRNWWGTHNGEIAFDGGPFEKFQYMTPVPEPGTLLLVGAGLPFLWRRRRS